MSTPDQQQRANAWFHSRAESFLRRIGVRECLQVADIGCNKGHFTLPAARIVGACGTVYAIDKDTGMLREVRQALQQERRHNVRVVEADLSSDSFNAVAPGSIDLALLFDILHRGYLPEHRQRLKLLRHIHRMVRPGGILSCFPTHLRQFGFTYRALLDEVNAAGFVAEGASRRRLVHDGRLVRGHVFRFRRT